MSAPSQVDFIVIGAGSAGCVLAARLTESGKYRVGLLEAGGEDDSFWIRTPLGIGRLVDDPRFSRYRWDYHGEPETGMHGRTMSQPRGKVLGGTGSINGMTYVRGQRWDFDHWRGLGNVGWGYDDVLPYFIRCEDHEFGPSAYHGKGGPIRVVVGPRHELGDALIVAGEALGFRRNPDYNGAEQDGFAYDQVNIRDGRRDSPVDTYLETARRRPNLQIITGVMAQRILVESGSAVGVEYRREGRPERLMARGEVIVAAGSFNSPQLLQVSGIGPGKLLQQHGVSVVADVPEVGENLQDHVSVALLFRCSRPVTINEVINNPVRRLAMGIEYVCFRRGFMAHIGCYGTGFIRSDSGLASPDGKIRLSLVTRRPAGDIVAMHPFPGFSLSAQLIHPESRGYVRIKSPDITTPPTILCNLLQTERDQRAITRIVRLARNLSRTAALARYVAEELHPGPECDDSDAALLDYARKAGARGMHAVGTCRMGVDERSVVDPHLRVRGVDRLRVIDGSIMPSVTGGNTHAPTVMIAEKGSDLLLKDAANR